MRLNSLPSTRTEKSVPVHRVSFWKGVLRDYLLRRRWVLKFLGKEEEKATSKKSVVRPPSRRTPCGQGQFSLSYLRRNDYQNNSAKIILCNWPGAITGFLCRAPENKSPNIFLVGAPVL